MGRILDAIFGKDEPKPEPPKQKAGWLSTHVDYYPPESKTPAIVQSIVSAQPEAVRSYAMDDSSNGSPLFKNYTSTSGMYADQVINWYAAQTFIGHQLCGIISQHWLVNKACTMPSEDAIRKGYSSVKDDGEELDEKNIAILKAADKKYQLNKHMREFIRKGRIFGVRIALFKVKSTDQEYYQKPFNIDGVKKGSFEGIVQIDPYWCAPMLDDASASRPDSLHFYEPTWWNIAGVRYHRSHLIIYRHAPPIDILRPIYLYGGVPLAQMLYERVFAAERTANEAPQLVETKRTNIWLTNIEAVIANPEKAQAMLSMWAQTRDNYGVKLGDKETDEFQQHDTSLTDLDNVIMTQYQLVAAISGVPATKLLGTQPKGFNSTGDYEEASYHEMLESIQENDLTPFAERFHQIILKSETGKTIETTVTWNPLDTPTAQELAQTNLVKAQTGQALVMSGAISSEEERRRIATDKQSGYNEMGLTEDLPEDLDDETSEQINVSSN